MNGFGDKPVDQTSSPYGTGFQFQTPGDPTEETYPDLLLPARASLVQRP
jgi:hypothetical protein